MERLTVVKVLKASQGAAKPIQEKGKDLKGCT